MTNALPVTVPVTLPEFNTDDPLGYGIRSIPQPLQRFWLIGQGNPDFDAEVRGARPSFAIPEPGFNNKEDFVDWAAQRRSRHGHNDDLGMSFTIDDQLLESAEDLTRFHLRNVSWPIEEYELPTECCPTDPLLLTARRLAIRYGIDVASSEPGFPDSTRAVVGYLVLNLWPHPTSLRQREWTDECNFLHPATGERIQRRTQVKEKGLPAGGGAGRQLPLWFFWWRLARDGKSIKEIAGITDNDASESSFVVERTIRKGIKAVERLMLPVEQLNNI